MRPQKYLPMMAAILLSCQIALSQSFLIVKNEKIRSIVPENAEIEKLSTGYMFTEGPVWSPEGYLLFSDIPANTIYKLTIQGHRSTFAEPTGNANGLMFDKEGNLFVCQHSGRQIAMYDKKGGFKTVCSEYEGKKFNSPNDLVIRSDGTIYFTDPPYGLPQGANDPARELPFHGVFMYRDGKVSLVDSTLSFPNGIILSPDEKYLYVSHSNNQPKEMMWFRYKVDKDGTAKGKKLFADASESTEEGGPDGMTIDAYGNLYFTGPGGICIYDPTGLFLGVIRFPESPANCCFGGPEGRTLYVTARTSVYSIRLNTNK